MKKLFFLAILPLMMAMVTFSSCSNDEGADNEVFENFDYPEDQLFGTWVVSEIDGEHTYEEFATFSRNKSCSVLGQRLDYVAKGSKIKAYYGDFLIISLDITDWDYPKMEGDFTIYDEDGDVEDSYEVVLKKN